MFIIITVNSFAFTLNCEYGGAGLVELYKNLGYLALVRTVAIVKAPIDAGFIAEAPALYSNGIYT